MEDLMVLTNHPPENVYPLMLAGIIAFGFVFIHPFMDGTCCDELYRRMDQEFDVSNVGLSRLLMFCLDKNGTISNTVERSISTKYPAAFLARWKPPINR
jgi:hypothetical protein